MSVPSVHPRSIEETRDALLAHPCVRLRGAGTKPALLARDPEAAVLDLSGLRGITDYDPGEFTFTAQAGTPLAEITATLAESGQYLPFDPPFAEAGATLGGTVAAGLSGPRRLRYGGIRDFIIGIRYLAGDGTLVTGGGKVVKNSAGFDLPKLFTGSVGAYGTLVELTFKVFPAPAARLHLAFDCQSLDAALALQQRIAVSQWEPEALDLDPPHTLHLTLAGAPEAIRATALRIGVSARECESAFAPFAVDAPFLAKLPVTPTRIAALDPAFEALGVRRTYGVAGNLAWLSLDGATPAAGLDALLRDHGLTALVLRGEVPSPFLGTPVSTFATTLAQVLDPGRRLRSPIR